MDNANLDYVSHRERTLVRDGVSTWPEFDLYLIRGASLKRVQKKSEESKNDGKKQ